MPSVQLSHISFSHRHSITVFDDVSIAIGQGWTGLVGANGAGKTTLLELIAGALDPDAGSITMSGSLAYCPQIVDVITPTILEFAHSWESDGFSLRGRLGLEPEDLDRWQTLSPGERKRWQVGAALSSEPDVLLLDEPTNHIDVEARTLVVSALGRFHGIGIIVSHDREVLNTLTRRTARIWDGSVAMWDAPYDVARQEWEQAVVLIVKQKDGLRRQERRLKQLEHMQRRVHEARQAADRRTVRRAGVKDKDARSMEVKARRADGEASESRRIARTTARGDRIADQAEALRVDNPMGSSIFVGYERAKKRVLLSWQGPISAGDKTLIDHTDVTIGRESRVWLRGLNGSGKTSLISVMLSTAALPPHRILWLPQDQTLAERRALVETVAALDRGHRGHVLTVLAALGVDPGRFLASEQPSPGEARKVTLALGLGRHAWCLVLDEPTNHLDLPSIERLEVALAAYPGALLLVSHDDRFATALTNEQWNIENRALTKT